MPPGQAIRALPFFRSLLTSLKPHDCSQSSRQLNSKAQAHCLPTPCLFSSFLMLVLWGGKEELKCTRAAYGRVAGLLCRWHSPCHSVPVRTRCPASINSTRSAFSRYSVRWVHSSRVVWLSTPRIHLCSRWLATSASTAARGSSRR